jgi:nitrogenase molybdenum-iron protein beta chain
LGYNGGTEFVDRLTNTLLDFYYDEAGYELEKSEEIADEELFAGGELV